MTYNKWTRVCKRCGEYFTTTCKNGKVCEDCKYLDPTKKQLTPETQRVKKKLKRLKKLCGGYGRDKNSE